MAPGAKLVVQDAGFLTDNCGDLPGIGCPVVDLKPIFQQAYTQGARIHTNSWGDNENAAVAEQLHAPRARTSTTFMFSHPDFLILFAAGNSGPGTGSVGSPSTAKNGISVGATLRGTSANSMASFSSCGPTADGRIKPDLTMPGSNIVSARNDGNVTQQQLLDDHDERHQHGEPGRRRHGRAGPPVLHRWLLPDRRAGRRPTRSRRARR